MTTSMLCLVFILILIVGRIQHATFQCFSATAFTISSSSNEKDSATKTKTKVNMNMKGDNKAMAFLKKIGKVGGAKVDFTNAVGVDEGSGGKTSSLAGNGDNTGNGMGLKKHKHAYRLCTDCGIIDDLSESFPLTSSGTRWAGLTDNNLSGLSSGTLVRQEFNGRLANVLTANIRQKDDESGGFVEMVLNLAFDHSIANTVDASRYDGIEFDVLYYGDANVEDFNVHLKDSSCQQKLSLYRATFQLTKKKWTTVKLTWDMFNMFGFDAGVENSTGLDYSNLRRIGIVAFGNSMDVQLGLSSIAFFQN